VIVVRSAGLPGSTIVAKPPYYERITADILARIKSGEWPIGQPLPSTRKLLALYREELGANIAMATLRRALDQLIDRGVLEGHQGVGIFVVGPDQPT
jgi:DNA-binding GntR family transcriptional regulator